jgi:hypothetical protein
MLVILFYWLGIVYHDFILESAPANKEGYKGVHAHLQEAVCLEHPKIWVTCDWILLHKVSQHISHGLCSSSSPSMVLWCFPTCQSPDLHALFTSFSG